MRRKIINKLSEIAFNDDDRRLGSRQDQIRAMGMLSDLYALQEMSDQDNSGVRIDVPEEYAQ